MNPSQPVVLEGDNWSRIATLLILGYLCLSRSFAYVGIPPWNLFLGEVILAYFLLFGPRTPVSRWIFAAASTPELKGLKRIFLMLFAFGVFQVFRGIASGEPPLTSVRDLAFNYYPLYLLLGIWVGRHSRHYLAKILRLLAWFNGLYGLLFILFLHNVEWAIPGVSSEVTEVRFFGQPLGSAVALIALLSVEKNLKSVWHLFLLNLFVLLGMQIRGEWLAFALALFLWAVMGKHLKRLTLAGVYLLLFFSLMYAIDLKLSGLESRGGGTISARDLVGRAIAPFDVDMASEYTSNYENAQVTTLWRTIWWARIWFSVHETPQRTLLGFGYGFPLGDIVPYLEGQFIRTPHNFFFYALGYTGWLGVGLFFAFQAELARLLWNTWKRTHQPFGFLFWVTSFVFAGFTAFFEVPYGAIPFYLIVGCVLGSGGVRRRSRVFDSNSSFLVPRPAVAG